MKYYCEAAQITEVTLCIYDTYGPGDLRGKLIGKFFEIAESGTTFPMSEGQQTEKMRTYYLRSEETYTLRELGLIFEKTVHKHLNIECGKRPYRIREVMEVYPGGECMPGWKAKVSIEEGLRRIAETRKNKGGTGQ